MSSVGAPSVSFEFLLGWVDSTLVDVWTQSASSADKTVDPAAANDPITAKMIPHNNLKR